MSVACGPKHRKNQKYVTRSVVEDGRVVVRVWRAGVTQAVNITAVSVADQLDEQAGHVSKSASLMHEAASYLRRAGPVIRAARSCVLNSAWAGVSDEDVALEQALRDGGWL